MGRPKKSKVISFCVICGDEATGINFNALTCMSCRAFFRRNALRYKLNQLVCSFESDDCEIDLNSRRFCTKCRLRKCFKFGMKKEWILTEDDKQVLNCRKKIMLNRFRRELAKIDLWEEDSMNSEINDQNIQITDLEESEESNSSLSLLDLSDFTHKNDEQPDQDFINSIVDEYCNKLLENCEEEYSILDLEAGSKEVHEPDYLTKCLLDDDFVDSFCEKSCYIHEAIPTEISPFPIRDLIDQEKCLLQEVSSANSILTNPYRKIVDYMAHYSPIGAHPISQYTLERLMKMSQQLHSFSGLCQVDQVHVLKNSLLDMLSIRSVLTYDPDREAFSFADDKNKLNVMVTLNMLGPFCPESTLRKHKNLYKLFRDEWKQDGVIFGLLTTINLFAPRGEYQDCSRIRNEQNRYCRLLSRYLTIKYASLEEAEHCYNQLQANMNELLLLSRDLRAFYNHYQNWLHKIPLFSQYLDL